MINMPKVHHSVLPVFLRLGTIFLKYPNDFLSKKYIIEIELKSQTLRLYKNYELVEKYKIFRIHNISKIHYIYV